MMMAAATMNTTHTSAAIPPMPMRCDRDRANFSGGGAPVKPGGVGSSTASVLGDCSSITNPRVENGIENIHGDIHEHVPHRDHGDDALELDELTAEDRKEQQLSHARD